MSNAGLIKEISLILFNHELKRLKLTEDSFIKRNQECGGSSDGFRFNGAVYTNLSPSLYSKARFSNAHESLHNDLIRHIKDNHVINFDYARVSQALIILLKDAQTQQDIRDALPECLVDVLPGFKHCPRTRPEAYTLADNPRSLKQYQEIREKIEFYLASKMLY